MTLQPIELPSLRPQFAGVAFPGTELPDLGTALREVQTWIDAGERPEGSEGSAGPGASRWLAWPDNPEFVPLYGGLSLNTGAAGIAWHALSAADATDGAAAEAHLARAQRAAAYVAANWRDVADTNFLGIAGTGLGFYGGLSGIGAVFLELADRFPAYRETAVEIFDEILVRAGRTGGRSFGWTSANALLGDGGVLIGLIAASRRLGDPRYVDAAVVAGLGILSEERHGDLGSWWHGLDGELLGLGSDIELDGFELGTTGIAFVFASLALAAGDERFRGAAARAGGHSAAAAVVVDDAAVAPRMGDTYSFGYCTGSSGAIRALIQVYRATGDAEHLEWALRLGRGILRSGVPGRQTPGNAWVFHQCCGSAAVLESFIGLWHETGDRLWLDAAQVQGDDLLIRSVSDARGRRWYSESHVLPVGTLKAEVGHQVGAAGIALALNRLDVATRADASGTPFRSIRLPDDPFIAAL